KLFDPQLAELTTLGVNTVRRHRKRLTALGVTFTWSKHAENGHTRIWTRVERERDVLRRLAFATPDEAAETVATGRARNHGGLRMRCPLHPDAPVRLRPFCSVCNRDLSEGVHHQDGDDGMREAAPAREPPAGDHHHDGRLAHRNRAPNLVV